MHPDHVGFDVTHQVPSADWRLHWLDSLRDELRSTIDIVDHPEKYGILWQRLDHHLSDAYSIINDVIRVNLGEVDPSQVEGGTLDMAVINVEAAAAELLNFAGRLNRFICADVTEYGSGDYPGCELRADTESAGQALWSADMASPNNKPKLTREERVQLAMKLGLPRGEAELHVNLLDGKVKDPHLLSREEWDRLISEQGSGRDAQQGESASKS